MSNGTHDVSQPISEDNPVTTEFEVGLRLAHDHHIEMFGREITEEEINDTRKSMKEANDEMAKHRIS